MSGRGPVRRLWDRVHYRFERGYARFWTRFLSDVAFVHINKTGGSSIETALGIPFQHCTALEMRRLMGERRYERAFSFAFVRDPWDKVASHYRYRVNTNQTGLAEHPIPFTEWVVRAYGERDPRYFDTPKMFMPQIEWITDECGTTIVDFVGRFECLNQDFKEVCRRLGQDVELPHLKSSGGRPDSRTMYDSETRGIVAALFHADLEAFGYRF